jgi:hypothetical protein
MPAEIRHGAGPSSPDSSVRHDTHVSRLTFNVEVQPAADAKRSERRLDRSPSFLNWMRSVWSVFATPPIW